nr:uncharacterized protein CTRU02_02471 [Colletotrichum truncatum]KAF6798497.1 hypothetical protein CTRU02_02471 [Colletotrichum truncatum]
MLAICLPKAGLPTLTDILHCNLCVAEQLQALYGAQNRAVWSRQSGYLSRASALRTLVCPPPSTSPSWADGVGGHWFSKHSRSTLDVEPAQTPSIRPGSNGEGRALRASLR